MARMWVNFVVKVKGLVIIMEGDVLGWSLRV